MPLRHLLSALAAAACFLGVPSAASDRTTDKLFLRGQETTVDLQDGIVWKNGISGICTETASRPGSNILTVAKEPGADVPTVTVNGVIRNAVGGMGTGARLGAIRLSRDGSLVHLRSWKTGRKQTELLQDGVVRVSWQQDTSVRLLRVTESSVMLLEDAAGFPARLMSYKRDDAGLIQKKGEVIVDFGTCSPDRLRLAGTTVFALMNCDGTSQKSLYRVSPDTGVASPPMLRADAVDFAQLPGASSSGDRVVVATVSGTPAALHFYHAVKGLLLSQTGEVRACSSDAEGQQSWNQSYRLRALADLYEKTGAEVFAALARKSMALTLAARDGPQGRAGPGNPACGWSSRVYSAAGKERLSLMINQAIIGNALREGCGKLGRRCPEVRKREIGATNLCLARAFEDSFDSSAGLYRIPRGIDHKFAGALAPWNWQVSFAALLKGVPVPALNDRAHAIVESFLDEWTSDANGSLWRYWPDGYYRERGVDVEDAPSLRYEDTGHAGISLLALKNFERHVSAEHLGEIGKRARFLLTFETHTPRDLNGAGPESARWFTSGGWADLAGDSLRQAYAGSVPGSASADTVYAYAALFDPDEVFRLSLDISECSETCELRRHYSYRTAEGFLLDNPFFLLSRGETSSKRPDASFRSIKD